MDNPEVERSLQPHVPHEPPFATAFLPAAGGAIGSQLEDFRVDEIPAYLPSGEGEHLYVRVEKRGLATPELVRVLSREARVNERDIGYAGLKDRRAVTTQWLSLPQSATAPDAWSLPDNVCVLEASRHGNKLRTGHLRGNRFRIGLCSLEAGAFERAQAIVGELVSNGLPNYFGGQRFGRGGDNLSKAMRWLATLGRARLPAFLYKLYPSVVQSEIFNRYLTLRKAEGLDHALVGEVMRLADAGSNFVVEDPEAETSRLLRRELVPMGPIVGPKMRPAHGLPLALEERCVQELGLEPPLVEALGRAAPGARRDLVVYPGELTLTDLGDGRAELAFVLPPGSYATVLVRELTRTSLLAADAEARDAGEAVG
jgi:tRNA pseudouridine13 synthase